MSRVEGVGDGRAPAAESYVLGSSPAVTPGGYRDRVTRTWTLIRTNPSGVLLVVQILGILAYPLLEVYPQNRALAVALSLFGLVVLGLALAVVRSTPSLTWVAVVIGIPAVVLTIVDAVTFSAQPWHLWSDIFHAIFYGYTMVGLLRYMFADDDVTFDELLAVGATFTVAVWFWAYLYGICQTLVPGSFIAAVDSSAPRTWFELLFLSCTTMTSTGLSDIMPVTPQARSLVMLQQIAGMLYLAIIVARLVGLALRGRTKAPDHH